MWARVRQIIYMGESSPDKIYGREFAGENMWARVRQRKYMGKCSPDKIYVLVPDNICGREFAR
jgi:hypothetical protein